MWLLHGGGFGATPPIARNVLFAIDEGLRLFPKAIWGVTATGRDMFRIVTLGLSLNCDLVRVGFEDGIHLPDGTRGARQQRHGAGRRADRRDLRHEAGHRGRGAGPLQDLIVADALKPRAFLGLDGRMLLLIGVCSLTFFLDSLIPTLMGPLAGPIAQVAVPRVEPNWARSSRPTSSASALAC